MHALARYWLLGAIGLFGYVSIPALAQETGVAGELERTATTSPQEKLQYASDANAEMRDAIKSVSKMVEAARRESNVDRLQCLSNRLTALRALVQVSEAAEVAMKDALSAGQAERADHEFRKIAVALTKSRQLLAEAERCMDDSGLKSGQTLVRVEGGIADEGDDTVGEDLDLMDLGEDPPEVSPFL